MPRKRGNRCQVLKKIKLLQRRRTLWGTWLLYRDPTIRQEQLHARQEQGNLNKCQMGAQGAHIYYPPYSKQRQMMPDLWNITASYTKWKPPLSAQLPPSILVDNTSLSIGVGIPMYTCLCRHTCLSNKLSHSWSKAVIHLNAGWGFLNVIARRFCPWHFCSESSDRVT